MCLLVLHDYFLIPPQVENDFHNIADFPLPNIIAKTYIFLILYPNLYQYSSKAVAKTGNYKTKILLTFLICLIQYPFNEKKRHT